MGLAAATTSVAAYMAHPELNDPTHLTSTFLGAFIGAVTLTGDSSSPPPPLSTPYVQVKAFTYVSVPLKKDPYLCAAILYVCNIVKGRRVSDILVL